jgi:hypothetical protein
LNPNRSIQSSNQTSAELGRGRGKDFPWQAWSPAGLKCRWN